MLLLIWFVVGVVLGAFVRRRSIAVVLGVAVWAISFATIAARSGYSLSEDSVGVFITLFVAVLGCVAGGLFRERQSILSRRGAG